MGPSFGTIAELRRFISRSWYGVTGRISEGHLSAGTRVEAAKRWKQATSYAERYLAKPEEFSEGVQTGRIWGVWNEGLLPIRWETVQISLKDAYKIRRAYRKLARRKGSGRAAPEGVEQAFRRASTRIGPRPTGPLAADRALDSCHPSPLILSAALREGVAAK